MSEMVCVKTDETLCSWRTMGKTKSHTQKNALTLGSLSEQRANEGNKAKMCFTKATGSRIKNELCEPVSCYSQCFRR